MTDSEVLAIRDKCPSIAMPVDVAAKVFAKRGYDDIDPENAWEEWQAVRSSLIDGDAAATCTAITADRAGVAFSLFEQWSEQVRDRDDRV